MKLRTIKFYIKEGFYNVYRNKLMSAASISIIASAILIFGVFVVITESVNKSSTKLMEQLKIKVYCDYELDDTQILEVENKLKSNPKINEVKKIPKEEAIKVVKEKIGDENNVLLEGLGDDFMPVAFEIKLNSSKDSKQIADEVNKIVGVVSVKYYKDEVEIITKVIDIIRIISISIMVLLSIIATFIISNTIKLAMFARKKEINIMKYIGATNWFVRWPFIIEGVVIGFIGAGVSFSFSDALSFSLKNYIESFGGVINNSFILVEFTDISNKLIISYLAIGIIIGILGSIVSIRKYLRA